MDLYNDNCFNIFPKIEDKSINLFLLDLPYANKKFGNCTACKWDTPIDLDKMWVEIKRMMKPNGIIVFYCNTKFGFTLIESNPSWFKYDLIWKKSRKVGFLSANKQPLRQHENIYIFKDEQGIYNPQKTEGKPYKVNGRKSLGYYGENSNFNSSYLEDRKTDNKGDRHPTSIIEHENLYVFKKEQGTYNPQKTEGKPYNKIMTGNNNKQKIIYGECLNGEIHQKGNRVINKGDRHPTSIIEHENIYVFKKEQGTYNPQKTEGKPYKCKQGQQTDLYGIEEKEKVTTENKGDRHPTSIIEKDLGEIDGGYYRGENGKPFKRIPPNKEGILHPTSIIEQDLGDLENTILEYNNPAKSLHRTQKPVELCEWLIKTYTNEEDKVMDFTMGSGTVGIACNNTNREFIGIEMDKEIFKIAEDRILDHINSD